MNHTDPYGIEFSVACERCGRVHNSAEDALVRGKMVAMDETYNLQDEVTPVIGAFKARHGVVTTIILGDAWSHTVYEVKFPDLPRPIRYIASDLKPWGRYSALEVAQLRLAAMARGKRQTGVEVNVIFDGLRYCPFCHRVSFSLRPEWHEWDCPNGLLMGEDPGDYAPWPYHAEYGADVDSWQKKPEDDQIAENNFESLAGLPGDEAERALGELGEPHS